MIDYTKELSRSDFRSDEAFKVYCKVLQELKQFREIYTNEN